MCKSTNVRRKCMGVGRVSYEMGEGVHCLIDDGNVPFYIINSNPSFFR